MPRATNAHGVTCEPAHGGRAALRWPDGELWSRSATRANGRSRLDPGPGGPSPACGTAAHGLVRSCPPPGRSPGRPAPQVGRPGPGDRRPALGQLRVFGPCVPAPGRPPPPPLSWTLVRPLLARSLPAASHIAVCPESHVCCDRTGQAFPTEVLHGVRGALRPRRPPGLPPTAAAEVVPLSAARSTTTGGSCTW